MLRPRVVFDALDLTGLRLETSTIVPSERRGQVRVTMGLAVATQLLEQIRARGEATESAPLLLACAAAFKAMDEAIREAIAFAASGPFGTRRPDPDARP